MTVRVRDLSAIRAPAQAGLSMPSLFFNGEIFVAFVPQALTPSGGMPPYTFSAVGLPPGISLDIVTGIISGTPTAAGATTATATAMDALGNTVNASVFFFVTDSQFAFTDDFSSNRVRQLYQNLGYGNLPGGMEPNIVLGSFLYDGGSASGLSGVMCTGAPGLQGQADQFMQITLTSAPALLSRVGPALKVSGSGQAGVGVSKMYAMFLMQFTGTLNLLGTYPGVPAGNYALALAIGAPAVNDIFELEINCGAPTNRIRFWQNNVLISDLNDADANRVVAAYGYPGWAGGGSGTAISTQWDNLFIRRTRV